MSLSDFFYNRIHIIRKVNEKETLLDGYVLFLLNSENKAKKIEVLLFINVSKTPAKYESY